MTTTLHPDFLLACIRLVEFKGAKMIGAQAGLLQMALDGRDFTAADLPGELTQGSRHLAGAATGSLVALGLIICIGRVKSPIPSAKGRKLDVLRLAPGKRSTAISFLRANGLEYAAEKQMLLI